MLQLNPPLPTQTPKSEGFAHILIDCGPEPDLYWTVFITATGEIWTFSNREVRASKNITPYPAIHGGRASRPGWQAVLQRACHLTPGQNRAPIFSRSFS